MVSAFTLLTVIPLPFTGGANTPPSKSAPLLFPVVGLIIGLAMAGAFVLADRWLPIQLAAALTLAVGVGITGAIHIDGVADFADGVFGGQTPEDRLRIMKLPDVGAFGVVAVGLVLLVDWTAVSSLAGANIWATFAVIGTVSRTGPLVVMSMTQYVSSGGLGQSYSGLARPALAGSILVSAGIAFVAGGALALAVTAAGLLMAAVIGWVAKKRLGGATGDVYGASVELAFAASLIAVVAILDAGEILEPIWTTL